MRVAAALALGCAACGPSAYACTEHGQCAIDVVVGMCQPDGHCSFPDDDCPSGQRYGEHGGKMAGECVAPVGDTEVGSSSSTSTGDSVTSLDATTATTTDSSTDPVTVTVSTSTTTDADTTTSTTTDVGTSDTTTDGPIAAAPLLWFAFDEMEDGSVPNLGALGGVAACDDDACPTPTAGVVGAAAYFDGVDDCAIFPFDDALGALDSLTIAAWLRRDQGSTGYDCVLCKPVGIDPWNTWRLATYDEERVVAVADFRVGTADDSGISIPVAIPEAQWVHVVGTWDGMVMAMWIDGELRAEAVNVSYEVDEQPVFLGCDDDHGLFGITNFLTGAIDEVRFYDRAISDDEIAALYAQGQ